MKKRCTLLTVLVVIALCVILLPTKTQAAEIPSAGTCGENLIFTYVNELLIIQGTGPMTDFDYEIKPPWDSTHSPIKKIIIYEGVTTIGETAFNSCYQLEEIVIPNTVTKIGKGAFTGCNIKTLTLPDSLESIGDSAFAYCPNLTGVTFGSGLKTIGDGAFYNCPLLQSVSIPAGVTEIKNSAFSTCTSLTGIQVDKDNAQYASDDHGALFSKDMTTLIQMPCSFVGAYTVPDTVTTIADRAFHTCRGLTEVILPNGLTSIGADAFSFCRSLSKISIPDSVTSVGASPFRYCDKLPFTIHGNAQYLGHADNPYVLLVGATTKTATEYPIPDGTKFICERAFEGCSAVKSITVPDSVIYLGSWAFARCSSLTNVTIGNNVPQIKASSFTECGALTDVKLGDKVETIEESAFFGCSALKNINFPKSLTSFGRMAFAGCNSLTAIVLPSGMTSIDFDVFAYCGNLTSVTFCGTEEQWKKYEAGFYSTPLENIQVLYHAFKPGTCTEAPTCVHCNLAEGEPMGHTPGPEPTQTTAQTCTVCGEELAPSLGAATAPSTQATKPSESTQDDDSADAEDETDGNAVFWIIAGTVVAAGGVGAGVILFKKYKLPKPLETQEPQE